ncbi:MAG: GTP-binding protein [Bacteroidales bacterium]|nr:GTP-binding protein [Bacteroidales bacterium]MBQ9888117.1 GTP-binding protein [Bacteroidales bacterium]
MTQKKEIPVLLLTGYLGSGKTTLVNRILNNRRGIRFAVIVNDLGEVNIDSELIEKGGVVAQKDDNLVALQNGCICCTLKMDLIEQLSGIARTGRFDYIVIEASGICEPVPIAQTICSIPQLGPQYNDSNCEPVLDSIVTVVDALRMQNEFSCGDTLPLRNFDEDDLESLIIQQIEFCNTVLLNKASTIRPEELGRVRSVISQLNPGVEIIECDFCDVDLDKIIGTGKFDFDKVATSAAWIQAIEEEEPHNEEEGEADEYGIGTYVYFRRKPFDINKLDWFVSKKWPTSVIRAKGICWFADQPDKCCLLEQAGVQKTLSNAGQWYATMPEEKIKEMRRLNPALDRDWDPVWGDRMQKLVFIGQNLDKKAIAEGLDLCLVDTDRP